jgi:pentatricopeptide repeat protein
MAFLLTSRRIAQRLSRTAASRSVSRNGTFSLFTLKTQKSKQTSKAFFVKTQARSLFTDTPRSPSSEKPQYVRMKELAAKKDVTGVRQLLDELKSSNSNQLDIKIYNPVIHMYHDMKNSDAVMQMYDELKSRDITPDEPTYNRIIYALINAKREDDSIDLYQQMNNKGIKLSQTAPDLHKIVEGWIDRRDK